MPHCISASLDIFIYVTEEVKNEYQYLLGEGGGAGVGGTREGLREGGAALAKDGREECDGELGEAACGRLGTIWDREEAEGIRELGYAPLVGCVLGHVGLVITLCPTRVRKFKN